MQKIYLSCLLVLAALTTYAQNTLTAGSGILSNGQSGPGLQTWGDGVTFEALKIDGSSGTLKYDQQFRDKGFGVQGARWDQIDYYQDYQGSRVDASEKIVLYFNGPVNNVVISVGMLGDREGVGGAPETGKWTAFAQNGQEIANGLIGPNESTLGPGVKRNNTYGTFPIAVTANQPVHSITIEATAFGYGQGAPKYVNRYDNESGNKENNSDFNLVSVTYTRQGDSPNNPPVAEPDGAIAGDPDYTVELGQTLAIPFSRLLANDSDPDGDPLTITRVQRERGGDVRIVGQTVEFTGTGAFPGALFRYFISDGRGGTDSAGVFLNVTDPADIIVDAVDDNQFEIREDIGLTGIQYSTLLANDIGENIRISSFDFTGFPGQIEDRRADQEILFTTAQDFSGQITFSYTITNGQETDRAFIRINVINVLDPPTIGQDGPFTTLKNTPFSIAISSLLANDNDPDPNETIVLESVQDAVNGTVTSNNSNVTFTPTAGFIGQASFTYTIRSGIPGFPQRVTSAPIIINVLEDNTPLDEVVLLANNLAVTNTSGPILWGTCATIAAFNTDGSPGILTKTKSRIGVAGDRYDAQLDYNPTTNTSEKVLINLNRQTTSATLQLGNLEVSEFNGLNETGVWKALNAAGNVLAEGLIDPALGSQNSRGVYSFTINPGVPFSALEIAATAYNHGEGTQATNNNSDFSIIRLAFTPLTANCNGTAATSRLLNTEANVHMNSFNELLNLNEGLNSNTSIQVYDAQRREVSTQQSPISFNALPTGLYIIHVQGAKQSAVYKVYKK